jgi:hypothetical protein
MEWDLNKIEQFYVSMKSNPAEFVRLTTSDPIGKLWNGYRETEKAFHDDKAELQALGVGDSSINPARSAELAAELPVLLERRTKLLKGLEAAVVVLGDQPQPDVRYLQARIVGLRRGRHDPGEIAAFEALIASLEAIASEAFA